MLSFHRFSLFSLYKFFFLNDIFFCLCFNAFSKLVSLCCCFSLLLFPCLPPYPVNHVYLWYSISHLFTYLFIGKYTILKEKEQDGAFTLSGNTGIMGNLILWHPGLHSLSCRKTLHFPVVWEEQCWHAQKSVELTDIQSLERRGFRNGAVGH